MKNYLIIFFYLFFLNNTCFAQSKTPRISPTASPTPEIPKVEESYRYNSTNKRDPFKPYNLASTPVPKEGGALTSYSIGQLRLTAVAVSPTGERKAIVEDNQGRGYTISNGALIGKEGGKVISIEENKLIIETTRVDFTGKEIKEIKELKINLSGPAGQIQAPDKKKRKR